MSKGHGPWRDSRRAWERLDGWQDERGPAPDGDAALIALADIGFVRHLLDQAELTAVRAARRQRKSWAEIAIKLGVTRQSAWERWRDLDEATDQVAFTGAGPGEGDPIDAAADEVIARSAAQRRRGGTVVVPNVIGLTWDAARRVLDRAGLVPASSDPDGPPLSSLTAADGPVTDQSPESGAKVAANARITLWFGRGDGGSAGVREPRRPRPDPRSGRELRFEPSDDPIR